jgi:predicted negative regulator of RcsB-dependent stress response
MTEENKNIVHELIEKINQEPDNAANYYALAIVLVKQQSFDQAEELLVKAKGLFSDAKSQDLLNYGLGNVYYESGMYDRANQIFQTVTDPKLKQDANLMIAQGYFAQNQYEMAFAFGLTAWEQQRENPDANELMGDISLAMGNASDAKTYYDVALKNKATAKLNFNRGVIEMTLTKSENNVYFDRAKQLDSEFFESSKQRLIDIDKLLNRTEEGN